MVTSKLLLKRMFFLDVDIGGILQLIRENVKRNKNVIKSNMLVTELDFTKEFTPIIEKELSSINLVFAADGKHSIKYVL